MGTMSVDMPNHRHEENIKTVFKEIGADLNWMKPQ